MTGVWRGEEQQDDRRFFEALGREVNGRGRRLGVLDAGLEAQGRQKGIQSETRWEGASYLTTGDVTFRPFLIG